MITSPNLERLHDAETRSSPCRFDRYPRARAASARSSRLDVRIIGRRSASRIVTLATQLAQANAKIADLQKQIEAAKPKDTPK